MADEEILFSDSFLAGETVQIHIMNFYGMGLNLEDAYGMYNDDHRAVIITCGEMNGRHEDDLLDKVHEPTIDIPFYSVHGRILCFVYKRN